MGPMRIGPGTELGLQAALQGLQGPIVYTVYTITGPR